MDSTDVLIMLNARRGERSWKQFAADIGVRPDHLAHIMAGRRAVRGKVLDYLGLEVKRDVREVYVRRFRQQDE